MPSIAQLEVAVHGAAVPVPIVSLPDRRGTVHRTKQWLFSKTCETILYGPSQVRLPADHAQEAPNPRLCA